jgi:RNA polymerase sigma factor (sigma-70 family)
MTDTQKLLTDYVKNGSESAFRELVSRYTNLVYSTAVRLVDGDSHLAKDVAQTVFVDLAGKAKTLSREVTLGGWLHRHTCFVAATILRGQRRRQIRERQAVAMNTPNDHSAANLAEVAPILDDAINQLAAEDRAAILLRFFEQLEFRAVGEALGSNEDAARMRVNRALKKLHGLLQQRGVTLSVAALGTALTAEVVTAAPLGMAGILAGTALAGGASGTATVTLLKFMSMTKLKTIIVGALAVAALATSIVIQHQSIEKLREDNQALQVQVAQITPLQAENERLSNVVAQAGLLSVQDSSTRELAKLRNEVGTLRQNIVRLRQQTNTLARLQEENRQLYSGMAELKSSRRAESSSPDPAVTARNTCINNLRLIDSAKQQWALEHRAQAGDTPEWSDLQPYLGRGPNGEPPVCPLNGAYTIGMVKDKPLCNVPGHEFP